MFPAYRPVCSAESGDAFYGLPSSVQFCSRCTLSNQRPASAIEYDHKIESRKTTLPINGELCDACKIHDLKHSKINWSDRESELRDLCDRYRRKDGRPDCLVPGSGGKDSIYAAHLLKHKYQMNPLTVTWAPHIYTRWGWENLQAWVHAGFDNYLFTPNGMTHRLLTRLALENLYHPFQPFIIGQKAFAPKLASELGIKLVFWGEPEAEDGNPIAEYGGSEQDWRYFCSGDVEKIYLSGFPVSVLMSEFGLSKADLHPYMPNDPDVLKEAEVDIRYMGYYELWHPQNNFYYAMNHTKFKPAPERTAGTYGRYSGIDDKVDDFHYFTTFIKFGIGRATYDSAQEVRNGDLERDEAVALIERYDGEYPARFEKECFDYLSINAEEFGRDVASRFERPIMDPEYFRMLTDHFRSPHLWRQAIDGSWELRNPIWLTG